MDWSNFRIFLAVARAGQFVAAAKQLKIDHATVGRRITALERSLNARLFERRTTGVSLTAAGTKLLASAERVESELLQVQAELTDTDIELSGTVRIGAPDGLSTYYLARSFRSFAKRYPAITIQLVPMPQAIPLAKREVDIVIVLEKPEAGRFITRKLTDYSLGLYGVESYFADHGRPASVEALHEHRLVGYVEDYAYSSALNYVRDLYGDAPTAFECASAVGQLEAIRAGIGLGVAHDYIARQYHDLQRVLPERRATRSYWIVVHEDLRDLGRIRAVYEHLVDSIQEDRGMFVRT
ncbi:MAG: LysR family transcriptional regulator [Beijerinckiaceae bacterium]|nr:LysR family transcriptional regulator [Beijerinckiaceae bacterium]